MPYYFCLADGRLERVLVQEVWLIYAGASGIIEWSVLTSPWGVFFDGGFRLKELPVLV
jgi:hypothetical protein